MRRHFRWRRISFSVSETGTREGRGKGGAARPRGSSGPAFGPGPHSPPGTGPSARGRGSWGPAPRAAAGRALRRGSRWDQTGRARRRVKDRPGLGAAGGCRGVAPGIPGPPPPAPAPLHTEVHGGGAARPHPGAGSARPRIRARPSEASPPRWEPGVGHLRRCAPTARRLGLSALLSHLDPRPRSALAPALRRGPILQWTLRPDGGGRYPRLHPEARRRGGASGGSPDPGAHARDSPPASWPASPGLSLSLPVGWSADAAGLGARRQAGWSRPCP